MVNFVNKIKQLLLALLLISFKYFPGSQANVINNNSMGWVQLLTDGS